MFLNKMKILNHFYETSLYKINLLTPNLIFTFLNKIYETPLYKINLLTPSLIFFKVRM